MRRLTLFGRAILLLIAELIANALCWVIAAILFARSSTTRLIMDYALLAWTFGLRHALDADHISAIDNATRSLIGMGQLPVTCGLYFSLGHSTIVIVVTVAIAVSYGVYQHFNGANNIGAVIGASVSGSFLFVIAVANSVILWKLLVRRRKDKERARRIAAGEPCNDPENQSNPNQNRTIMLRILGPVINFVNRPWKMYPVGVLFGLSFDTASSIALIAVTALAHKGDNGVSIPSSDIIILPFLFTAGMTLVDSADSILVLYSYAGLPSTPSWSLLTTEENVGNQTIDSTDADRKDDDASPLQTVPHDTQAGVKTNAMSMLSIILTLMSILVAFSISLITIMGLIGERCAQCAAAANAEDGGGLAGSWWRAWARANNDIGYIGAAIVGMFLVLGIGWVVGIWFRRRSRRGQVDETNETLSSN
ncbi:NicO-domain-containing protein [Amanita rubescens]|nr:NicO-domain-containing protein [Amanita rubescens]